MPNLTNKKLLNYELDLLYNIITDVEKYNQFIPWCKKVTLLERQEKGLMTEVEVEFLFIKEKYTSLAAFFPPKDGKAKTDVEMIEGPFHHFSTIWELEELSPGKTVVTFICDFSFNNTIYDNLAKVVLKTANNKILAAFMSRAEILSKEKMKNML